MIDLATVFYVFLTIPSLAGASETARTLRPRASIPSTGFFNPYDNGGAMLTEAPGTGGLGEPLNAIISGNSDKDVLVDQATDGGLRNYFQSFGFSSECLGQHSGDAQAANLGDGRGYVNESAVIRWDYGDPALGTCTETIQGGNHFRYWVQDGKSADSNAIFMATSYEKPIKDFHDIIFNGYNLGRDWLVGNVTGQTIPTSNLTNTSSFSGSTSANGYTYKTDVVYLFGILPNTTVGLNHNTTVGGDGIAAIDGLVAVLTVAITAAPAGSGKSAAVALIPHWTWPLVSHLVLAVFLVLPVYAHL